MLDQVEHARIIQDFEQVCMTAGVQGKFLHESMTAHCGDIEVDWVRNFNKYRLQGQSGLLLEGVLRPDVRCQAIAGAFLRNFIDARVIPLNTVLELKDAGNMPSPTVLLIPNLFVAATSKNVPAWKVQIVYDLFLERTVQGKACVAYVESLTGVTTAYGKPFGDFLKGFKLVSE